MFLSLSFLSSLPPRERPLLSGNSIGESCEIKQFIEPPACGVYTADVILQTINKGKQRKTSKIINIQSSQLLSRNLRGGPHKLGNKLFHINKNHVNASLLDNTSGRMSAHFWHWPIPDDLRFSQFRKTFTSNFNHRYVSKSAWSKPPWD